MPDLRQNTSLPVRSDEKLYEIKDWGRLVGLPKLSHHPTLTAPLSPKLNFSHERDFFDIIFSLLPPTPTANFKLHEAITAQSPSPDTVVRVIQGHTPIANTMVRILALRFRKLISTMTFQGTTPAETPPPSGSRQRMQGIRHNFRRNAVIPFGAVVLLVTMLCFNAASLLRTVSARTSSELWTFGVSEKSLLDPTSFTVTPLRDVDLEHYTIRINTWERHDQLLASIKHHASCSGVAQIQVIWGEPAEPLQELLEHPKVVVERHTVDSLNERFHILKETPTLGILSIDDDVLRPCEAIDSGTLRNKTMMSMKA